MYPSDSRRVKRLSTLAKRLGTTIRESTKLTHAAQDAARSAERSQEQLQKTRRKKAR